MDMETANIVDAAKTLLRSAGYCVDNLWHVDDVHFICEQQNLPRISNAEAMEVFSIAAGQFDGEMGISWPQLEKALRAHLQRMTILKRVNEECLQPA
jgi:hypothetical protein